MCRLPSIQYVAWCMWSVVLFVGLCSTTVSAEDYATGDAIEYKVRGATPQRWERGVIIRELDGGKQYLIHEKPSQFFPDGPEVAYAPSELRRPQPKVAPTDANGPAPAGNGGEPSIDGKGLLSKDDVFNYARQVLGPGDPFAHPNRDALLDQIRDYVKAHGTNFLPDLAFSNRMSAIGAYSVRISFAIEANYGPAPKLEDYFGTFLLRTANRGSRSVTTDGSNIVITREDAQYESGELTINKDGTYTWQVLRGDPPAKWLKGKWREVAADEMNQWDGGPAIWLENAKQGEDYMVRMCRVPGWLDWIDVGMGKARTPVEYGRRP